ncbi:MAG: hypothetical protein M3401_18130 [Actinomycetota bacterium]|nr:hypothetical protein [Actinomycetota bacterium]
MPDALVVPDSKAPEPAKPPAGVELTRAEAHALRRSEPLTTVQFKALRVRAEQSNSPLPHL